METLERERSGKSLKGRSLSLRLVLQSKETSSLRVEERKKW